MGELAPKLLLMPGLLPTVPGAVSERGPKLRVMPGLLPALSGVVGERAPRRWSACP
jgi:hypothetical protein